MASSYPQTVLNTFNRKESELMITTNSQTTCHRTSNRWNKTLTFLPPSLSCFCKNSSITNGLVMLLSLVLIIWFVADWPKWDLFKSSPCC
jgi:hypothetical protein